MSALLRLPPLEVLTHAPISASIYLLASAAYCNKTALEVEHPDIFDFPEAQWQEGSLPSTVSLAARHLHASLGDLLRALALYQAALQDAVHEGERSRLSDLPF